MRGRIESITKPISGGGYVVTMRMDTLPVGLDGKDLDIELKEHKEHRSKDANAFLWACIADIERALNDGCRQTSIKESTWEIYLRMLKRYGKYSFIIVKPEAVEAVKKQWREAEVYKEHEVNGQKAVQMICYYGSSTYNTREMSRLLEGVLSEMDELNIPRPNSSEMNRAISEWERKHNAGNLENN